MRRHVCRLLSTAALFVAFVFGLTSAALAQIDQGTITGTVTDQQGAVIPKARVIVTNTRTQVARETLTNDEGYYRVPYLLPGQYELVVESQGFNKGRVSGIVLTVGLTATINVSLTAGMLQTEAVTITATPVQVERQGASLGNVVGSKQIIELPLLGRNPYDLLTLTPGVVPKDGGGSGPIINGGRSSTSEILLDGAETRNTTTNGVNFTPPLEAVQEFKVITNSMSAEFGRSGGGVLTAGTRPGTNELHGSFYEFLRNDKLNANSFFNNLRGARRGAFRRNEYGFSVGGPVYVPRLYDGHNRTFFFFNWEQAKQRTPDDIVATVPTELERTGDFSRTVDNNGNLIKIYDPTTTEAIPDPDRPGQVKYIRQQFRCGEKLNVICPDRIDPIARRALEFFPLPNRSTPTLNFIQSATRKEDSWRMFMRIDHSLGKSHKLFLTYGRHESAGMTPGINLAFPAEGTNGEKGQYESHPRTVVIGDTVTLRPDMIGEFRASFTRGLFIVTPRSVGYDFTELGFPQSLKDHAKTLLFPRFNITDLASQNSNMGSLGPDRASYFTDAENTGEVQGHVTWLRGAHSLKSGFDLLFNAFNIFRPERPAGSYDFGRAFTQGPDPLTSNVLSGYGVATFLLGAPTGGSITDDPSLAASQRYYSWYVQDDWKARRNLTLSVGLRWEYQTPWSDRFDLLGYFDPDAVDPLTKQKGVLRFVGRDGNPRYQSDPDRNNFAPRVGLSWEFMKDTVMRIGYGLFYFPGSGGIGSGVSDLGSGFLATTPVFLGQSIIPNTPPVGASLSNPFVSGFMTPPSTGVGGGIGTAFRDWVTPYNHQWNLNFQRSLTRDMLVEVAYIGSRGQRIWVNRARNAVSTQYLSMGSALDDRVPNPYFGIIPTGPLSTPTVARSQLLKPYPHYTDVGRFRDAVGDSVYHGLTVRVDKRLGQGLIFQAAYTVSKQIDNVQERFGGRTNYIDPNNLSLSRSIGDYDRPQLLVMNYIYELPFGQGKRWLGRGWAGRMLGNWQISGITTFGSGLPVVITGPNNTRLPGVSATAVKLKSPILPEGEQTIDRWFDTSAFVPAQPFTLGSDSRTQPNLRGPGINTFDLMLSRSQRIKERVNVQFRAEFYNAFNTPQFREPVGDVNSRDFGRIIDLRAGSRNIQFGLRISY
jgi:Carboxypeptidase regulatory-like domain/TonB-dependent Receptor Plug Domain